MADKVIDMLLRAVGMPPSTKPGTNGLPDADTLSKMSWNDLMSLRKRPGLTREDQNTLGPYDHRAYTRENVLTPYDALQNVVLTAGYTPWKAAASAVSDKPVTRSDPSLAEIGQALMGIAEGVKKNVIGDDTSQ